MSVFFRRFLSTIQEHPILLVRYIDDIFLIWPNHSNFSNFKESLDSFHQNIKFTAEISTTTVNFLDITIYKNNPPENNLQIKTFQKSNNLYQYLHFTSQHHKPVFKGIVVGESIRYARTNSTKTNYLAQLQLFKTRLLKRGYPSNFIEKYTNKIRYENRNKYIKKQITTITSPIKHRPLLKCPLPPRYKLLQEIVLSKFETIQHLTNKPIFIYTNHNAVKRYLVNSKHPSDTTTILNIYSLCHNEYPPRCPTLTELNHHHAIKKDVPPANISTITHTSTAQLQEGSTVSDTNSPAHPTTLYTLLPAKNAGNSMWEKLLRD